MSEMETADKGGAIDWNGAAGRSWVDLQGLLDHTFKPVENLLTEAAAAHSPEHLLDIGCGAGGTTLALARYLGPDAHCAGIDISAPLIEAARMRAEREGLDTRFLCADAQDHDFAADSVDAIVSRFGVMFFADPVAAFANLRRAARPDTVMTLIAWRDPDQNPFMTAAARAAAPIIALPERQPNEPGQFGFADADHVHGILSRAGWAGVDLQPVDFDCGFPVAELGTYLLRLGPLGMALEGADAAMHERVLTAVRPAFDRYVAGDEVRFTAACWMITARDG
ncbi:MAG: methyltransferase domain-containing protein [Pseudomonadota bacterium]